MTAPETSAIRVFRPSPAARQRTILWGLLPALPLLFITLTNSLTQPRSAPLFLGILVVAGSALAAFIVWYVRVTRIEFGGGTYRYVTSFVDRRFTSADVERMVAIDELHYGLNGARMLYLVGRTRRHLLRLHTIAWDTPQVEAIVNDLLAHGVPLTHIPERITPGELNRREPGLLRWVEAHRVAFALLLGGGVLLLAIIAIVVILAVFLA